MNYTFFVDESGQSGIKKIRTTSSGGASRYMTLGGALVPNSKLSEYRNVLSKLASEFSKPELHCSKLNHNQIVRFAQEASKLKVLLFGVISLKETLGGYRQDIDSDDKRYYNKCAQYLLEKLGQAMEELGIGASQLSIAFEDGNFEYQQL